MFFLPFLPEKIRYHLVLPFKFVIMRSPAKVKELRIRHRENLVVIQEWPGC